MFFILSILLLTLIVTAHEFGHFLAAKAFRVGVVEFAVGMGPRLVSKRLGETVYSIRALPVGGFCAMYGEDSAEARGKGEACDGPNPMGYKTDWAPERSLERTGKGRQVVIMLAGPFFNMALGFLAALFLTFMPGSNLGRPVVAELSADVTVAYDAGVRPGDVIVAVEDRMVYTAQDYNTYVATHPALADTGYTLVLQRGDGLHQVFLVPDPETGLVGITYSGSEGGAGVLGHAADAWNQTRHWALVCLDSLCMLARGDVKLSDMSGFIGMTSFMGSSIESSVNEPVGAAGGGSAASVLSGLTTVLVLVTLVSVNLGIMNLLPIPALDGGRAVIAAFEGLFRRRVPVRAQALINAAGFGILVCLLFMTTVSDILRLIGVM